MSDALPPSAPSLFNRLLARGKFRHVQVLLLLAELGSVQRTADAIGMTQSSVTQTLAYLEGLLELRLFERHARGVRPTPACTDLLPVARQLMLGLADGAEAVATRHRRGEGMVRMLGSASAIHGLLVDALPAFAERHPAIQVQLSEAEGEDQLLAIARGEVDLAVCRRPPVVPEGWVFHPLREDRFIVVARAAHPLAGRRRRRWTELAAHTWLLLPASVAARHRFDALARAFAAPVRAYPVVTRSLPMLWWLLQHRELLALVPLNLARPLLDAGQLVEVRTDAQEPIEPIGILRPEGAMGEAARRLAAHLERQGAA